MSAKKIMTIAIAINAIVGLLIAYYVIAQEGQNTTSAYIGLGGIGCLAGSFLAEVIQTFTWKNGNWGSLFGGAILAWFITILYILIFI